MSIDYKKLPVYEQKEKILECLRENQVIIVQSPTGSGKTTQIPVILHEAGYSAKCATVPHFCAISRARERI